MRPLRPHQTFAIEALRSALKTGSKRPMLQAPTGAGKTTLSAALIDMALSKGKRIIFTVPAIPLIDQTAREFWNEGIRDVGVIQADHPMTDSSKPVQIASVQTLRRRFIPDADLVIIDEAHRISRFIEDWMTREDWLDVPFIGLSATPWSKGLGRLYDRLIIAATTSQLIEKGYLAPFTVFAPSKPDLSKVRTKMGDYHEGDLSQVMCDRALTADIVSTWLEKAERRPTLCFAVDRTHARTLQAQFEQAGVRCGYLDGTNTRDEREEVRKQFASGALEVVCNVGVLSTGIDWDVRCIILARPTKSEMLYCLDSETEVLSSDGWLGIGALSLKHSVASWLGGAITFSPPRALIVRDRAPDERMVTVAGKTNNIRVTEGHRMLWSNSGARFDFITAGELEGRRGFVPVSGFADPRKIEPDLVSADTIRTRRNGLSYKYRKAGMGAEAAAALAEEHQAHTLANQTTPPADLTLDECSFIGFWLGDGTKGGGRYALVQSERYAKIVEWVDGLLARIPLHHTRDSVVAPRSNSRAVRWHLSTGRGGGNQRRDNGLARLLPYLDKDGSALLWGLSADQLKALLHGLWLADGNHGCGEIASERGKQIFGTRRSLFDLLQGICACRGIRAGIHTAPARRENYKPLHTFYWKEQQKAQLVRDRMQVEELWRPERVWCVETEAGTIITRRRGKVTVMGNCQIIGRGLRTAEGKDDCLILDHSDTTLRLGFVTDIHHNTLNDGTMAEGTRPAGEREPPKPKECPSCHYVRPAGVHGGCPRCGHVAERSTEVEVREGELVELTRAKKANKEADWSEKVAFMRQLHAYAIERGYQSNWAANKYREKFGVWPNDPRVSRLKPAAGVSKEVRAWITSRNIRYAKRRDQTRDLQGAA